MKRAQTSTITSFFKKSKKEPAQVGHVVVKQDNVELATKPGQANHVVVKQDKVEIATKTNTRVKDSAQTTFKTGGANKPPSWSKAEWVASLSDQEKDLLSLEIDTLGESWLAVLAPELTKPYFLNLKRYLAEQRALKKTIFPPADQIYSWSRLTPVNKVRVVILGQDPYHNHNQAHGLAFSVNPPTTAPPSLINIFKELESCYPDTFKRPSNGKGQLTRWADQGVLMLNTCLTVEAHRANSHANRGWETFTERVLKAVLDNNKDGVCFLAWGSPAARRVDQIRPGPTHLILKSVHPSPLSASRGWFGSQHFVKANNWLQKRYGTTIDWNLSDPVSV